MRGDELRAAVESFNGRPNGMLLLMRGRDRRWRLRALEGGEHTFLDGAVGEWLLDGDVLAVRRSGVETVMWAREAEDAGVVVARRVVQRMGAERADRALANLERKMVV